MANEKLTQEELQRIQQLQNQSQGIVNELGTIEITRINLDARYNAAKEALNALREAEQGLAKELQEKYGDGTINLNTGEIELTEE